MSDLDALREMVAEIEAAYLAARDECQHQADQFGYDVNISRDTAGRFLLLDALTQLVAARAVLVAAQK